MTITLSNDDPDDGYWRAVVICNGIAHMTASLDPQHALQRALDWYREVDQRLAHIQLNQLPNL